MRPTGGGASAGGKTQEQGTQADDRGLAAQKPVEATSGSPGSGNSLLFGLAVASLLAGYVTLLGIYDARADPAGDRLLRPDPGFPLPRAE
jgi:hypothetical protein